MPTINQLVRKNRSKKTRKSKSPVLGIRLDTIKRKTTKKVRGRGLRKGRK